jgi:hypothetical protein
MTCEDVRHVRVEDVEKAIAFIPEGHQHVRLLLKFKGGQTLILQQALIDGLLRAYVDVGLHPLRRAVELIPEEIPKSVKKAGFARWQLVESHRAEDEVLSEAEGCFRRHVLR